MIGIRGVTRFTSRMATTMMRPLSSSSSAILFHDVTAANANGIVANKISFKLEKGDRVALTGPNQEGKDWLAKTMSNIDSRRKGCHHEYVERGNAARRGSH
jgi:ATPase subunit of ABC transporter with duplicated ATPase domains